MAQDLVIMSGLAVRGALEKSVLPAFEAQTGMTVKVTWDPTTVILKALARGDQADLVIVTDEAIAQLAGQGICDAAQAAPLANAVLGVAVKRGAPRPDIATVESFRQALLDARSVAYSQAGASGIYFAALIERLQIGAAVRAKATLIPKGFTAEKLVTGEADLAIQQISELMLIEGIDVAGAFPDELQSVTGFTAAALHASARQGDAARLLRALISAEARQAYQSTGLALR